MRAKIAEYIIRLVALFPLRISQALGTLIGNIAFTLPNSLKQPLKINIDLCYPDLSPTKRAQLYRNSFVEMSRATLETGALWTWNQANILNLVKTISGKELLESAFGRGKGVILALPHLGAWELMGLYCSSHYPMTSLYRPLRLNKLNPFVKNARQRFGATLVPTNATGIRKLYKALERNELVAMLPDQDPGREGSIFAPFFGIQASTMTLLPKLLQKTGAALIFGYAERLPHGAGYHIHFLPADSTQWTHDLIETTTLINHGVETCIRQQPSQYQWAYKRFKTRPDGEPRLYP